MANPADHSQCGIKGAFKKIIIVLCFKKLLRDYSKESPGWIRNSHGPAELTNTVIYRTSHCFTSVWESCLGTYCIHFTIPLFPFMPTDTLVQFSDKK